MRYDELTDNIVIKVLEEMRGHYASLSCIPEKKEKYVTNANACLYAIRKIESQVNTAEWIVYKAKQGGIEEEWYKCSNCGWENALLIPRNFCPNCGTRCISGKEKE